MYRKPLCCIICFLVLALAGCAAQKEQATQRPPKQLISKVEGDLERKPIKRKPAKVDYKEEGVSVQSIEIIEKDNPREQNQRRFIDSAIYTGLDDFKRQHEKGARVNFRNENNDTVLINLMKGSFDNEIFLKLEYLLSVGAEVNFRGRSKTSNLTTPLDAAVYYSSAVFKEAAASSNPYYAEQIIRHLIDAGAYVSGADDMGRTPLHTASKYDNLVAARILLEAGAEATAKDYSGKTPLNYAASEEMIRLLRDFGATDSQEPGPEK